MPNHDSDLANFSRLVEALRPWLGQVIFIGGWVTELDLGKPLQVPGRVEWCPGRAKRVEGPVCATLMQPAAASQLIADT